MRKDYDTTFFCMLNESSIQCLLHVAYEKCIGKEFLDGSMQNMSEQLESMAYYH